MELIFIAIKLLSVAIFFLILYDLKWGMISYLLYFFLVPIPTLGLLPVSVLSVALFGMSVCKYGVSKLQQSLPFVFPYGFLLLALGIVMPISPTPFSFQFWMWKTDLINGLLSMWAMWLILVNSDITPKIKISLVVVAFVVGIYALALTQTGGVNPYVFGLKILTGGDILEGWYADENRLFGRISSTFLHPMTWAFVAGSFVFFVFFVRRQLKKTIFVILMSILILNVFFCGVRSVIGALFVSVFIYLLLKRQFKIFLYSAAIGALLLLVLSFNDFLFGYVMSIFDFSDNNEIANGSSFSMRLNQLSAALKEMGKSPLWGNGYSWHSYYLTKYGDHPELLAFESLVFTILCDSGVWGVICWILYLILLLALPFYYLKQKEDIILIVCFVFYYFSYVCVTGDYAGYFFLWFYILMLGMSYKKDICAKKKIILEKLLLLKLEK